MPMAANDALPVRTSGARWGGLIKRSTIHFYTHNMKAMCLVVSKKIFMFSKL